MIMWILHGLSLWFDQSCVADVLHTLTHTYGTHACTHDTHTHTHERTYARTHIKLYAHIHTFTNEHTHTHFHKLTHTHTHARARARTYARTDTSTRARTRKHIHIHTSFSVAYSTTKQPMPTEAHTKQAIMARISVCVGSTMAHWRRFLRHRPGRSGIKIATKQIDNQTEQ